MRGMLQGGTDIPLNEQGRELAQEAARKWEALSIDFAVTSPLSRAKETARIVLGQRDVPLVTDDRIREISFGEFEGLCYKGEGCNVPDPDFMDFFDAPCKYKTPPGAESFAEILARTGQFWQELQGRDEYQNKTILISTHGCALKAILANICNTPLEQFWGTGCSANCALTCVEVKDGKVTVWENVPGSR